MSISSEVLADGREARERHADDAGQEAGSGRVRACPGRTETVVQVGPGRRLCSGGFEQRADHVHVGAHAEVDIGLTSGRDSGDEVDPCAHRLTEHLVEVLDQVALHDNHERGAAATCRPRKAKPPVMTILMRLPLGGSGSR